jgi:hypothetical protein
LIDPCSTAVLVPQTISTLTAVVDNLKTIPIFPTDSVSPIDTPGYCGTRVYSIAQQPAFVSIVGDTLVIMPKSSADMGSYSLALTSSLASYPLVPPVVKQFTLTVVSSCTTATLVAQNLPSIDFFKQSANFKPINYVNFSPFEHSLSGVDCGPVAYKLEPPPPWAQVQDENYRISIDSDKFINFGS